MDFNNDELLGTIYGNIRENKERCWGKGFRIGRYLITYMYQDFK